MRVRRIRVGLLLGVQHRSQSLQIKRAIRRILIRHRPRMTQAQQGGHRSRKTRSDIRLCHRSGIRHHLREQLLHDLRRRPRRFHHLPCRFKAGHTGGGATTTGAHDLQIRVFRKGKQAARGNRTQHHRADCRPMCACDGLHIEHMMRTTGRLHDLQQSRIIQATVP